MEYRCHEYRYRLHAGWDGINPSEGSPYENIASEYSEQAPSGAKARHIQLVFLQVTTLFLNKQI